VSKSFEASQSGALVVLLVPARTDTRWFHDWIQGKAEIEFVRSRLRFGGAESSAPFPSMLAVYSPNRPAVACARCGGLTVKPVGEPDAGNPHVRFTFKHEALPTHAKTRQGH
jgi:hypothetical protein